MNNCLDKYVSNLLNDIDAYNKLSDDDKIKNIDKYNKLQTELTNCTNLLNEKKDVFSKIINDTTKCIAHCECDDVDYVEITKKMSGIKDKIEKNVISLDESIDLYVELINIKNKLDVYLDKNGLFINKI